MITKTTVPISKARNNLFKIAQKAQMPGVYYTLTESGKPTVVILSADEFDSMQETLETMSDLPGLEEDIRETEKDIQSGAYKKYRSLEDVV